MTHNAALPFSESHRADGTANKDAPFPVVAPLLARAFAPLLQCRPSDSNSSSQQLTGDAELDPSLICPECEEFLCRSEIEGFAVNYCPQFHGMMVSMVSLGKLISQLRANYMGDDEIPVPLDMSQLETRRICPKCRRLMDVHPYHGPGNAVIDSCTRCHAVWLDDGETIRIVRAPGPRGRWRC